MGGCCYGQPVQVAPGASAPWWCIVYPEAANPVGGLPVHATPIYESLASLLIAAIIYFAIRKEVRRGVPTMLWFTLYPIARFIVEQFRGDRIRGFIYQGDNFYISTSQFIGIIFIIVAVTGWVLILRGPRPTAEPAAAGKAEPKKPKDKS
jgi:prolipoprotein diacylglyceryltransferase